MITHSKDEIVGLQSGDISPLAELRQLYSLVLRSCQITDITPLTNLSNLNSLVLSNNSITDISPLAGLIHLNWLRLCGNHLIKITMDKYCDNVGSEIWTLLNNFSLLYKMNLLRNNWHFDDLICGRSSRGKQTGGRNAV